jgi:hypothetical protein
MRTVDSAMLEASSARLFPGGSFAAGQTERRR